MSLRAAPSLFSQTHNEIRSFPYLCLGASLLVVALNSAAFAGSPRLTHVHPAGGQRGSEVEIET
jgi:hypothetical protein